jgi:hypothetical protein
MQTKKFTVFEKESLKRILEPNERRRRCRLEIAE